MVLPEARHLKYFYRVDHAILQRILAQRIRDERLLRLLNTIINSEDTCFGLPAGLAPEDCSEDMWLWDVGMPIGNLTSQLFANIYLDRLDQYAKHQLHIHHYIRYMDDIVILSDDKKELAEIRAQVEEFLFTELHLSLNKKTTIRPITLGIDFVGYQMWATHRKLKKATARRIIRHVSAMCEMMAAGELSRDAFDRAAASYNGIFQHCNSYGLRQKLNSIYREKYLDIVNREPEAPEAAQEMADNTTAGGGERDGRQHHPEGA